MNVKMIRKYNWKIVYLNKVCYTKDNSLKFVEE